MVLCGFFGSVTKSKFSALDTNTVRAWVPLFWWTWSCGETETQGFRKLEYLMRPVSHARSCIMLGTVTGNLWPLYIRLSNGGIVIEMSICMTTHSHIKLTRKRHIQDTVNIPYMRLKVYSCNNWSSSNTTRRAIGAINNVMHGLVSTGTFSYIPIIAMSLTVCFIA